MKTHLTLMADLYEKEAEECFASSVDERNSEETKDGFALHHIVLKSLAKRFRSAASEYEV